MPFSIRSYGSPPNFESLTGLLHIFQADKPTRHWFKNFEIIPIFNGQARVNIPKCAKIYTFLETELTEQNLTANPGCQLIRGVKPQFDSEKIHLWISEEDSLGFALNENWDKTVRSDMREALRRILESQNACLHEFISNCLFFNKDMGSWQGPYSINSTENTISSKIISAAIKPSYTQLVKFPSKRGSVKLTIPETLFQKAKSGLLHILTTHTSCSIACLSESEAQSREPTLSNLVPESWNEEFFEHTYEGPDDMPAHVKCAIQGADCMVPIDNGKIPGNTSVYIIEHRDKERDRKVIFRFFKHM